MTESEVLQAIENGDDANGLLFDADPKLEKRFHKVCKSIADLLSDVKQHFPDACYYTDGGGLLLMLGNPHDSSKEQRGQQQLVAVSDQQGVAINDGGF